MYDKSLNFVTDGFYVKNFAIFFDDSINESWHWKKRPLVVSNQVRLQPALWINNLHHENKSV